MATDAWRQCRPRPGPAGVDRDAKKQVMLASGCDGSPTTSWSSRRVSTLMLRLRQRLDIRLAAAGRHAARLQVRHAGACCLKARVEAMKEGGTFVMFAPPNPYRCPPGPYERISMIAHRAEAEEPDGQDHRRSIQRRSSPNRHSSMRRLGEAITPAWSNGSRHRSTAACNVTVNAETMVITTDIDGEVVKADACDGHPGT